MTPHSALKSIVPFLVICLTGGASAKEESPQENANGGYFLLHELCSDEAQLPMLMIIKTTPKEISALADKISKISKDDIAALDRIKEHDKSISFDSNPLPQIERDVRDSIKESKQHQLVFGSTGQEFARVVLVSQIEASTYGQNIAKVLADHDKDADRSKTLRHISDKWNGVRLQCYAMLGQY